jgi:hypothetical protein
MRGFRKEVRDPLDKTVSKFVRHGKGDHDIWRNPVTGKSLQRASQRSCRGIKPTKFSRMLACQSSSSLIVP